MGEIADEHINRMMGFGHGPYLNAHPRPRPGFTVTADDFDVVPDDVEIAAPDEDATPLSLPRLIEECEKQLAELPVPESDEAVLYDLLKDALPYLQRLAAIDVEDLV